jgi:deoxyribodipyrimidine photo-lyase
MGSQKMREHEPDERPEIFTREQIERCETYDELWNATQREMNLTGEVHNYVRMLWGKLVIQWAPDYEEAFAALDDLNNRLCLDGRNPNSYAGILWCFGKHDRPWKERPIFGKMRYMTSRSTGRKFDAARYIEWTRRLQNNPALPPVFDAEK